jgi:hypothetical protein
MFIHFSGDCARFFIEAFEHYSNNGFVVKKEFEEVLYG